MSAMYVENVPDDLYDQIEQLALARGVSVGEQTVQLLRCAVNHKRRAEPTEVLDLLERLRRDAIIPSAKMPDSVELLREDRQR